MKQDADDLGRYWYWVLPSAGPSNIGHNWAAFLVLF